MTTAAPTKKKRRQYGYCKNCGDRYEKKRRWQDFCKQDCRYEFHHKSGPSFKKFETLVQTQIRKAERRILSAVVAELRKALRKVTTEDNAKATTEAFRAAVEQQLQTEDKAA